MLIVAVRSDIVNCQKDKSIALSQLSLRAIIAAVYCSIFDQDRLTFPNRHDSLN